MSPNDNRKYRALRLDNGLNVLCVSDEKTEMASAAMSVGVGSMRDPKEWEGIAHFCGMESI